MAAKRSEITEKVYQSDRKAVAIKEVVSTLEAYENDVREYKILTSNTVEDSIMLLNLQKTRFPKSSANASRPTTSTPTRRPRNTP